VGGGAGGDGETTTLACVSHGATGKTPDDAATHGITLEVVNRHGKVDLLSTMPASR
jgi:hypothetical protein